MTENFEYKVGGSLGENAPSYVVRQADGELYRYLKLGEFCYIFNSRQMGKTSLIVRTMNQLVSEGYACTSLDFSVRGGGDMKPEQWYAGIVYKFVVNFELGNPKDFLLNWWKDRSAITGVERLDEFIETVLLTSIKSKIVIFIDEIDSILSLQFPTDDFFALIRSCYEKRNYNPEYKRLTFAFVGVATPGDLISDKRRTPFNIGKAIQLDGFKDSEIEPLAKGFDGIVENPNGLIKEVLNWTGGQPFLTQKVCKLLKDEEIGREFELEPIIQSKIIDNWEAHDEPEHLKTIRDRMLLGEQIAGRFLGLYQQILLLGYINADNSLENMRFRLLGLVVKEDRIIKVYNQIYKSVFNLDWVEKELGKLRPYAESFQAWVDSNYQDESRLLRGKALEDALIWASEKSLSYQDTRYLTASQDLEKREIADALAIQEEEAKILAAANETLNQAQKKSLRMIKFGSGFFILSIVGAIVAFTLIQIQNQKTIGIARLEQRATNLLRDPLGLVSIEGLSKAVSNARELKSLAKNKQSFVDYPAHSPIFSLQYVLQNIKERNRFDKHQSGVYSVVFSPNGKRLATASLDKTIKLWNLETGKLEHTLRGHEKGVYSVAFSRDGKTLASGSQDKTIKLWNVTKGEEISTLEGHLDAVRSVAFSRDGKTLATASFSFDKTIKLWNVSKREEISTLRGHTNSVMSVAFSPDGKTLATASVDKTIKLWSVNTSKPIFTLKGHKDAVVSVAFSSDGKTLASGSSDNTIKLWNTSNRKLIDTTEGHNDAVTSVAFSRDDKTLASTSSDDTIKLWDISKKTEIKEISTLNGHLSDVYSAAFSADNKTLVTGSWDKTIRFWDISNVDNNYTLEGHDNTVKSVVFSRDSKILATGSWDNTIKLWDVNTRKEISTLDEHKNYVNSVAFSRDGKTLATASSDKTIKLWDISNILKIKPIHTLKGHTSHVWSVAFSSDGKTLASGSSDKTIKLWDVSTGEENSTLDEHKSDVWSVAFSGDGKTLATASSDKTIKLWDISNTLKIKSTHTLKKHEDAVNSVAFSPDGKTLASGSKDKTIKLWNVNTGKEISTLKGHQSDVYSIAFNRDGKTLATASFDKTIKLWDVNNRKLMYTLIGHENAVWSIAFSPDKNTLATASEDKTIKLWNLDLDDLLAQGCDFLEEYLASRDRESDEETKQQLCPSN